jgi:hypothetical protein
MPMRLLFLVCALICFVLATLGMVFPNVHLGWLGLALLTLSHFPFASKEIKG